MNKIGRYLWASPWTLAGLALGLLAMLAGARSRRLHGTLEISGGRLLAGWPKLPRCAGFGALTLGHVILATDVATAAHLRAHERVHVRQYETWGVLFVPAYVAAGAWQWTRGRHPYRDNPFERAARDA